MKCSSNFFRNFGSYLKHLQKGEILGIPSSHIYRWLFSGILHNSSHRMRCLWILILVEIIVTFTSIIFLVLGASIAICDILRLAAHSSIYFERDSVMNFTWESLSKYLKLLLLLHVPHLLTTYSFTENSGSFSDVNFAIVRWFLRNFG